MQTTDNAAHNIMRSCAKIQTSRLLAETEALLKTVSNTISDFGYDFWSEADDIHSIIGEHAETITTLAAHSKNLARQSSVNTTQSVQISIRIEQFCSQHGCDPLLHTFQEFLRQMVSEHDGIRQKKSALPVMWYMPLLARYLPPEVKADLKAA